MQPDNNRVLHGTFETRAADVQEDRVPITVSTADPMTRGAFKEVLDHSPGAVDMSRAPLSLVEAHDTRPVNIGLVEGLSIAGDRLRGFVRFGAAQRAQEVLRDVLSGVVRNVSVGYEILEHSISGDTVTITRWQPYEVSVVGVGLDPGAGFYRAKDQNEDGDPIMKDDDDKQEVVELVQDKEIRAKDPPVHDITAHIEELEGEGVKKERERQTEIRAIAARFPHSKKLQIAADAALSMGESHQDFARRALDLAASDNPAVPTELGLTGKEVKRYSVLRMIRAQLEAKERGISPEKIAPYEYRCHLDIMDNIPAKRADLVRGMLVPYDVQMSGWGMRAPPADTAENIHLVSTDHMASQFIVGLRETAAVMAAGATVLNGLVGDVSIPREESVPVEWLTEDEDATDVDYVTSSVTLTPTTVAAAVPITRRLMKQSSPDADRIIQSNISLSAGQEIDKQALQGSGVSPLPTGVRNQTGVSTVLISTGALTWAEAVKFETDVEIASNLIAGGAYIMHPQMKGIAKTTSKDAGSGQFIWADNAVNGYRSFSSTHAGATPDGIVFGSFSNLLIGFWGVLDVMSDPYTKAASGGLVIRVFQDVDVAVRRGEAFAIETLV